MVKKIQLLQWIVHVCVCVCVCLLLKFHWDNKYHRWAQTLCPDCRVIKMKGMVFRYTWVYSKEDTMAHTYRAM